MAKKRSGRKSMSLSIFSILALALVIITVPLLLVPFYNMQGSILTIDGELHTAAGFDFLGGFFTQLFGEEVGLENLALFVAFSNETNAAAMLTGAFVLVLLIAAALYLVFFLLGVCGIIKKAKNLLKRHADFGHDRHGRRHGVLLRHCRTQLQRFPLDWLN